MRVRTSEQRWVALAALVGRIERAVEYASRLDGLQSDPPRYLGADRIGEDHEGLHEFGRRLRRLDAAVDGELDRLTAEYCYLHLKRRIARDRAVALRELAPPVVAKIA